MNITLDTDTKTIMVNGETVLNELIEFAKDHNLDSSQWKITSFDEEMFGYQNDEVQEESTMSFSLPVIMGHS